MSIVSWLIKNTIGRSATRAVHKFFQAAREPQSVQQDLLLNTLRRESQSAFGRDHHFASIRSVAEFRRQVPITDYDYFAPYIERVKAGESQALFADEPVVMFALTSGTTSSQKFIPVTQRYVDEYRRGWLMWGAGAFFDHPRLLPKKKLVLVSDADEFRTPAGIPCGSMSGLTAAMQSRLVRRTYVLPPESAKIHDAETKYYLAWRLGLVQDVGMWISPNPSTHLNLARFGDKHKETLIHDIATGEVSGEFSIPAEVLRAARRLLRPNKRKAQRLERILRSTGTLRPKDVWPNLGLVGCWLGGCLGAYARHFPDYFGNIAVRDIGLIASESRMTIPKADGTAAGCLDIQSTFFEFVPQEDIESPNPTVLQAHELEEGRDYFILLTTSSGLYRYNISDVVRCVGRLERTPMLEFLHKGSHISNVTGEKVSEHQVVRAVESAIDTTGLVLGTYSLAPCWNDSAPYYGLFVENRDIPRDDDATRLAAEIDRELCKRNLEYRTKRDSRRLAPVRIEMMPSGWWSAWDREQLNQSGGTPEQYKHPALIPDLNFREQTPVRDFEPTNP